ncbi:hypothetical protein [Arthrobacter sp. AZCC_0090]|uniref:hypothetical protein n=1 Tax=Arthrobacter sp. AZCC_0090 TaxID=2735881 RepID=UPI00160FBEDE|nr:hypothetical protein [Arthrobacter sp. AZCC_0090]MBB6407178.1 organic hydroperoxide reductase OsmC/OhrA [Arthrobacter sp. AZCC_0090]
MNYTAEASVTRGGRDGDVRSDAGMIQQRLAIPAELGLLKLAHERCPYSRAISGNVEVTLELVPSASAVGV